MAGSSCDIWFYHLERSGPEAVLPDLLMRSLGRGWRALVRTVDAARLQVLDDLLWTFADDSFLPHGLAHEPFAADQPVLLSHDSGDYPPRQVLFLLDGAGPGRLDGYERCVLLFDGRDQARLAEARQVWKQARQDQRSVSYWRQGQNGWEKQA